MKHHKTTCVAAALFALVSTNPAWSADPVDALQQRLQQMERDMAALRAELELMKAEAPSASAVADIGQRVTKVEQTHATVAPVIKGNRVIFRGGYSALVDDRSNGAFTDMINVPGALAGVGLPLASIQNRNDDGWYFGGGFDFLLSRDTLGLLPGVWTLAELGLEYRDFGSTEAHLIGPVAECLLLNEVLSGGVPGATNCTNIKGQQNLSMLTVSAAPKLKFREGARLRPWIIPAGVDFNVISPPSDSTNYLDIGVQFGAGIDFEFMPGMTLGIDARYHLAANTTDPEYAQPALNAAAAAALGLPPGLALNTEQNNDAWTVGVSLGIGF